VRPLSFYYGCVLVPQTTSTTDKLIRCWNNTMR
jgi:hypothetical protein